jgi:N-succinyl-L-ornithine transcarbamylase
MLKKFTSVQDVDDLQSWVQQALELKKNPIAYDELGKHKTLVLLFFNPSLRTRLSTQKAGINLGMSVITMNAGQGWQLEFEDNIIMNTDRAEHIKEAAAVVSQYADIIGIRTFPSLTDKQKDYDDFILNKFIQYAQVPVVSLESAILHPLQSFADVVTIEEYKKTARPKVVLSWAPHPKALPQAVSNSFVEWMKFAEVDLSITHPKGYELSEQFTNGIPILHNQDEALENADFVYAKNWSCFQNYGTKLDGFDDWQITEEKMKLTNNGKFMHCLPIRRNVVASDFVLDSENSLIIQQANNRTFSAQAVLLKLLQNEI